MPITHIHQSEQEDFEVMLKLRKLSPDDFELTDTFTHIAAPQGVLGLTLNKVFVKSTRSGIERAYTSGGLSITNNDFVGWVGDVARDIDAGVFR